MQQVLGLQCLLVTLAEVVLEQNRLLTAVCSSPLPLVLVQLGIAEVRTCPLDITPQGMVVGHLGQMLVRRISTHSRYRQDMEGMIGEGWALRLLGRR